MIRRYQDKEINDLWNDQNKFNIWWKIEILNVLALKKYKLAKISTSDVKKLQKKVKIDCKKIESLEKINHHDVFAFLEAMKEQFGDEQRWIHYGLTSTDVVDSAQGKILKEVNLILNKKINLLKLEIKKLIKENKKTFMMGRTHGVHAEVTTLGYKFAYFLDQLNRAHDIFIAAIKEVEVGKISGAVGNYANNNPNIQDFICQNLGIISSKISTQVLSRDRHSFYVYSLSLIGNILNLIALEIRHLQKTEINEIAEGFLKTQKGSSAMPHKKNPIKSENISGLSRVLEGYSHIINQNIGLWHERDISHSSTERVVLCDATNLLGFMLEKMTNIISNLFINKKQMLENINTSFGVCFSQRVMLLLVEKKGMTRTKAYGLLKKLSEEAILKKIHLKELLKEQSLLNLTNSQIESCFDLEYYYRNMEKIYRRLKV